MQIVRVLYEPDEALLSYYLLLLYLQKYKNGTYKVPFLISFLIHNVLVLICQNKYIKQKLVIHYIYIIPGFGGEEIIIDPRIPTFAPACTP